MATMLRTTAAARRASANRTYVVLPGMAAPIQTLLANFAVQSANAAVILAQPDLTLSLLATLPEDQALLRQHATQFRDSATLSGGIMASFQAIATISNAIVNAVQGLAPVAEKLDKGSAGDPSYEADLQTFRSVLTELSTRTTSWDPDSQAAALVLNNAQTALAAFLQNQISDDVTRFETAEEEAAYSGNIQALKLADLRTADADERAEQRYRRRCDQPDRVRFDLWIHDWKDHRRRHDRSRKAGSGCRFRDQG